METLFPERYDISVLALHKTMNTTTTTVERSHKSHGHQGMKGSYVKFFAMMEAVLILAAISQKFRFTLSADRKVELQPSITLRPKHGLNMRLQKR